MLKETDGPSGLHDFDQTSQELITPTSKRPKGIILKSLAVLATATAAITFLGAPSKVRAEAHALPEKMYGVYEDDAQQINPQLAQERMDYIHDMIGDGGYVKETVTWVPGQRAPSDFDWQRLENSIEAAHNNNLNICLIFIPATWKINPWTRKYNLPPTTLKEQKDFVALMAKIAYDLKTDSEKLGGEVNCYVVGNEWNNPLFFPEQFADDGTNTAAITYEHVLWRAYQTIKQVSPDNIVVGGELASRGNDKPSSKRPSQSPGKFIEAWAAEYKKQGRLGPEMDILGLHAYQDLLDRGPLYRNHNTTIGPSDTDRLKQNLSAFDFEGSHQDGSSLKILVDEFGVQSTVPSKLAYRYDIPPSLVKRRVDAEQQGKYYQEFLKLEHCKTESAGGMIFHAFDERERWQSGSYYRGFVPKPFLSNLRVTFEKVRAQAPVDCSKIG